MHKHNPSNEQHTNSCLVVKMFFRVSGKDGLGVVLPIVSVIS